MYKRFGKSTKSRSLTFLVAALLAMFVALPLAACNNTANNAGSSAAKQEATSAEATAEETTTEEATTEEATTEESATDEANGEVDIATTFPSWNADSKSLHDLIDFVKATTTEGGPDYVAPEDRIATFDMDGTIICEKAPTYIDWCMLNNRVLDNPSYNEPEYTPSEEAIQMCQEIRDTINAGEKPSEEMENNKASLITSEFAGMTPEEFHAFVKSFAASVDTVGFETMTYAESFYKPMLEVFAYLKANDFDVWMVSACEREVVRALTEDLDIPADHIIGTDVGYYATNQGEEAYDKYTQEKGEEILLGNPLGQETAKTGKVIAIMKEIGKRPILAGGNSSGDHAMLNYAVSNPEHKGMGLLVIADDDVREHGDPEATAELFDKCAEQGWTSFSMANDWATIYGEGVVAVAYPGVGAEELALAA